MDPDDAPTELSALEFALLNRYQRDFPLTERPYAVLAQQLGTHEQQVMDELRQLRQRGLVSRVGAVFRPNAIGASALAALAVPPQRLDEVAGLVSALPEVNHNYQREHVYNLWFVAAAASPERLQAVLRQIEQVCGFGPVLVLPLMEDFHIDLGFDLAAPSSATFSFGPPPKHESAANADRASTPAGSQRLSPAEQTLLAALQPGLALVARPYAALGLPEADAMTLIARWCAQGVVKRFGVVVRHHELGYRANAMAVWDVPDQQVSALGREIASTGRVTLCYRRNRQLPAWPYNLFCMIHGKDRAEVAARIDALSALCRLDAYPHAVLFSCRRFKQCGAQYSTPPEMVHG